jgi:hypothetical protein
MNDRIYLSREEQTFLMEMLEIQDPVEAVDRFAYLIVLEKADPTKLHDYLKKIMRKMK